MGIVWLQDLMNSFLVQLGIIVFQFFDRNVFLSFSSIGHKKEMKGIKLKSFFCFEGN